MFEIFKAVKYFSDGGLIEATSSYKKGGELAGENKADHTDKDEKKEEVQHAEPKPEVEIKATETIDPKAKDAPATLVQPASNPDSPTAANETDTTLTVIPVNEEGVSEEVPVKSESVHDGFVEPLQIDSKEEGEQIDIPANWADEKELENVLIPNDTSAKKEDELIDINAPMEMKVGGPVKQTGKTHKKIDETIKAKPSGYRYSKKLATKLGVSATARPTQAHIERYINKGVYYENRRNRSDIKPSQKLAKGGFVAGAYEKEQKENIAHKLFDHEYAECSADEKTQVDAKYDHDKQLFGVYVSEKRGVGEYIKQTYDLNEAKSIAEGKAKELKKEDFFDVYIEDMATEEIVEQWNKNKFGNSNVIHSTPK